MKLTPLQLVLIAIVFICVCLFVNRLLEASYLTTLCSSYAGYCTQDSDCQINGEGEYCNQIYCKRLNEVDGSECAFREDFKIPEPPQE